MDDKKLMFPSIFLKRKRTLSFIVKIKKWG